MAIGVDGQYLLRFNVGSEEDFIDEDDLTEFSLIEEVGNILPSFQMVFATRKDNIVGMLSENNQFKVSFGRDRNSLVDTPLSITTQESSGMGTDKKTLYMSGLYSALPYMINSKLSISEEKSAIEVISDVVGTRFITDFNASNSLDSQRWIQPNVSDRKFVNEMWLHADLNNSFPAVGISSDGKFILKDIKKRLSSPYDWRFTKNPDPNSAKDLVFDDDYTTKVSSGFINSIVGYGREKLAYVIEEELSQSILKKVDPIVAITRKIARSEEVEARFAQTAFINDNVHENYWDAFLHNVVHLIGMGAVKLTFSFQGVYIPIRILDLVMFRDTSSTDQKETASHHSGLYFVSKVARTISNRQFITVVEVCRESMNELRDA